MTFDTSLRTSGRLGIRDYLVFGKTFVNVGVCHSRTRRVTSIRFQIMTVAGKFSTMSMADLIQWGRTAQRTGLLTLSDEEGKKKIKVVFRDGRIVFSSTNEVRERWHAYLVYHGFCSDEDIETAFKASEASGALLASILVADGKITQEQAVSTLTEKTIEDL